MKFLIIIVLYFFNQLYCLTRLRTDPHQNNHDKIHSINKNISSEINAMERQIKASPNSYSWSKENQNGSIEYNKGPSKSYSWVKSSTQYHGQPPKTTQYSEVNFGGKKTHSK